MNLEVEYAKRVAENSDIKHHLPTLRNMAWRSGHVTELGVRGGNSTIALLVGRPGKLISYDLNPAPPILKELADRDGVDFTFHQKNVLEVELEPTEFLFIDTLHTADQLDQELRLHADKASYWMAFHDTETFGFHGEGGGDGLLRAIGRFLIDRHDWCVAAHYKESNGLTVLAKTKDNPDCVPGFQGLIEKFGKMTDSQIDTLYRWGLPV